jgi:hypothetical protein
MAKKSRRVRRKGTQPRLSETQMVQPTEKAIKVAPPAAEVAEPEAKQPSAETDFQSEYRYVVKDLQRIGLLAAAMLGGLLILSFVL